MTARVRAPSLWLLCEEKTQPCGREGGGSRWYGQEAGLLGPHLAVAQTGCGDGLGMRSKGSGGTEEEAPATSLAGYTRVCSVYGDGDPGGGGTGGGTWKRGSGHAGREVPEHHQARY